MIVALLSTTIARGNCTSMANWPGYCVGVTRAGGWDSMIEKCSFRLRVRGLLERTQCSPIQFPRCHPELPIWPKYRIIIPSKRFGWNVKKEKGHDTNHWIVYQKVLLYTATIAATRAVLISDICNFGCKYTSRPALSWWPWSFSLYSTVVFISWSALFDVPSLFCFLLTVVSPPMHTKFWGEKTENYSASRSYTGSSSLRLCCDSVATPHLSVL